MAEFGAKSAGKRVLEPVWEGGGVEMGGGGVVGWGVGGWTHDGSGSVRGL